MSLPRFYLPQIPNQGPVCLSNEDARHASSVLRLKVGERVQLFDGCGNLANGQITSCGKSTVEVDVVSLEPCSRELPGKLELFVALPKGDRQKVLVDLLVQMGVHQMTPLETTRGVAQPTNNAIERLQKSVIESSKQCGRNFLMQIAQPISIDQLCADSQCLPDDGTDEKRSLHLFAHPYGSTQPMLMATERVISKIDSFVKVAVGPEGGLTDDECDQLRCAGWLQISLGRRILRVEAAAAAIAATWAAVCEASTDKS